MIGILLLQSADKKQIVLTVTTGQVKSYSKEALLTAQLIAIKAKQDGATDEQTKMIFQNYGIPEEFWDWAIHPIGEPPRKPHEHYGGHG